MWTWVSPHFFQCQRSAASLSFARFIVSHQLQRRLLAQVLDSLDSRFAGMTVVMEKPTRLRLDATEYRRQNRVKQKGV
jgi:hypothetical protein